MTPNARAKLVVHAEIGCATAVGAFHEFLGPDAARLKGVEVSDGSSDASQTRVTVSLDNNTVSANVVKIAGQWRLDSNKVANKLLGIKASG